MHLLRGRQATDHALDQHSTPRVPSLPLFQMIFETGQVPAEQVLARAVRPDFALFFLETDPISPMRLTP